MSAREANPRTAVTVRELLSALLMRVRDRVRPPRRDATVAQAAATRATPRHKRPNCAIDLLTGNGQPDRPTERRETGKVNARARYGPSARSRIWKGTWRR